MFTSWQRFLQRSAYRANLSTLAPIAKGHFFAHVTHTSCIADDEGKHDEWRKHFLLGWNVKACVIMGWLWTQVFSEMSCNDMTVQIDNRFKNFAAILLAWMLGDPHLSFRRSPPFLILSILTKNEKKNLYVRSYKCFAFYAPVRPKFSFLD